MLEVSEIKSLLRENVVELVFTKKDGSDRTMICTLMPEFLPELKEPETTPNANPKLITVWDLEAGGWRSFYIDKVKSFEAEPIEV